MKNLANSSKEIDDFFASQRQIIIKNNDQVPLINDSEMIDYCFDRITGHRKLEIKAAILHNTQNAEKWRSINDSIELVRQDTQEKRSWFNLISHFFSFNPKQAWGSSALVTAFTVVFFVFILPKNYTMEEITSTGFEQLSHIDVNSIPLIHQQVYITKSIFKPQYQHSAVAAGIRAGFLQKLDNNPQWQAWLDTLPDSTCTAQTCSPQQLQDHQIGRWLAMTYMTCQSKLATKSFLQKQQDLFSKQTDKHLLFTQSTSSGSLCDDINTIIKQATNPKQ